MKIAIVGPAHPYKGGIAKHTTEMAHQLTRAGHDVEIYSWKHQYPFFYPGEQFVPDNKPEVTVFPKSHRILSWRSPLSWVRVGRQLRSYDKVLFVWWVPTIHGPVYSVMLRALAGRAASIMLCHNVLPHESKPGDTLLARAVAKKADRLLVHSEAQAEVARNLASTQVQVVALPPVFPPKSADYVPPKSTLKQLLFFGLVRPYKGLDVLLAALARNPGIQLIVAGEIWGENTYETQAEELGIAERVTFLNRYVADEDLQDLFAAADAVVLPYRGGTATFNVSYAHYFGLPVIATRAASMEKQVIDGRDGLLCKPDDIDSLAAAIALLYTKDTLKKLRKNIPATYSDTAWQDYVQAIEHM